jgi:cytochrome c-type biogenesis protein CcmH
LVALILLPIGAVGLYLVLGSPQLPGEPARARISTPQGGQSIAVLVSQIEAHLERNPNDARGYEVLAPIYLRIGRFDEAVAAWRKLIALEGDNAARESDLGEALTAAANGVVTDEAKAAFEKAAKLDPADPKPQFYRGMAAEQDGNKAKAVAIWSDMLKAAPTGAPWIDNVKAAIVRLGGTPPQVAASATPPAAAAPSPNAEQVAAASQMSAQDRDAMIRGMVARLADKLKNDGNDVDGWQRLLRAYVVLGDRDKAQAAAGDARRALAGDPDKLRQIEDVIKSLNLQG